MPDIASSASATMNDPRPIGSASAAAKTCTAMCSTCLRVECGLRADHDGACRCFDHMVTEGMAAAGRACAQAMNELMKLAAPLMTATSEQLDKLAESAYGLRRLPPAPASVAAPGANPACGTQETACAAHEKPNQSAAPGDLLGEKLSAPAVIDDAMEAIAHPYQPPTVTPIEKTRTLVSMNGRDWLNYALLDEASEPLNKYPHWQIWRGDELLVFHPSPPPAPPTCGATSEDGPTGLCGALATHRPNRCGTPLCDRCYLAHERQISHWTARDPAHWSARLRMDLMAYNERGWGRMDGPEPVRPCTPTAWGGIFDPQADR